MSNPVNFQDRKDIYLNPHPKKTTKMFKQNVYRKKELNIENDEPLKAAKLIPHSTGILIQQKRQELKLSQKDLALKINEKVNVIKEIETGNCKYNRNLLNKLERVLNIKL